MEIGGNGLANVNITIPQGCSLSFEIVHKDADGNAIDHRASVLHMAAQKPDGTGTVDLSEGCTGTETGITVTIPADTFIPVGRRVWDLIAETAAGETIRMAYGTMDVVDTYAMDDWSE